MKHKKIKKEKISKEKKKKTRKKIIFLEVMKELLRSSLKR